VNTVDQTAGLRRAVHDQNLSVARQTHKRAGRTLQIATLFTPRAGSLPGEKAGRNFPGRDVFSPLLDTISIYYYTYIRKQTKPSEAVMQQEQVTSVKPQVSRFEMPYRLAQFIAVLITVSVMLIIAAACNAIATM